MAGRRRVAVLISGRGSNMASLIEAAQDPAYPAEIVLVVSNRPEAGGLERARAAGIATAVVDHKGPRRASFRRPPSIATLRQKASRSLPRRLLRILTPASSSPGPWLLTPPSLLPSFKGKRHARSGARGGVVKHGLHVHSSPELDFGPSSPMRKSPYPGRHEATWRPLLAQDHLLYPRALALCTARRVRALQPLKVVHGAAIMTAPPREEPIMMIANPRPHRHD